MKSKRFWAFVVALILNYWLGYVGLKTPEVDLISLGTFLAMGNVPILAYIAGETYRPSGLKRTGDVIPTQPE